MRGVPDRRRGRQGQYRAGRRCVDGGEHQQRITLCHSANLSLHHRQRDRPSIGIQHGLRLIRPAEGEGRPHRRHRQGVVFIAHWQRDDQIGSVGLYHIGQGILKGGRNSARPPSDGKIRAQFCRVKMDTNQIDRCVSARFALPCQIQSANMTVAERENTWPGLLHHRRC